MNKERIFDIVAESFDSEAEYCKECAKYRKKHGFYPFLDMEAGLDEEEQKINRLSEHRSADYGRFDDIIEIFELDREQVARLYTASRFLRKWNERTEWQFCPTRELVDRLWKFVEG